MKIIFFKIAEPGPLEAEGKDIEQVLSIISNSIYRCVQCGNLYNSINMLRI